MVDPDTAAERRMRRFNQERERRLQRGRERGAPIEETSEALPGNWRLEDVKQTRKGSHYTMLVGEIAGTYQPREPVIILHRPHDAGQWSVKPGRHYIDAGSDTLAQGAFQDVLRAAVELAREQNARWAEIPGFDLP